jgi:hypothetical protein
MVRFSTLREAYIFKVYRETFDRAGNFRLQINYDPFPELELSSGLLDKCQLGMINVGHIEFRQDRGGSHDGYEITAAGIEHVEDQLEADEDRPRPGTPLAKAIRDLPGLFAGCEPNLNDRPSRDAPAPAQTITGSQAERPSPKKTGSLNFLSAKPQDVIGYKEAQDAISAVVAALVAELAESSYGTSKSKPDGLKFSLGSLRARAKLLVAPRASAALLDGLILQVLERLGETGILTNDTVNVPDPSDSGAIPNAQASGH